MRHPAVSALPPLLFSFLLLSCSNRPANVPVPPPPSAPPTTFVTAPPVIGPVKIVIECENATALEDKDPHDGQVILVRREQILGDGKVVFLESPDKVLENCPECKELKEKGVPGSLPGKALYEFTVPRDGDYYLHLRAFWHDSCGNSVWLRLDQGLLETLEDNEGMVGESGKEWAWHTLLAKGEPRVFRLAAGPHKLQMCIREDGPQFDKFLISSDATPPLRAEVNP